MRCALLSIAVFVSESKRGERVLLSSRWGTESRLDSLRARSSSVWILDETMGSH